MYSHYDTNMSKERGNPMRKALEEKGKKRKRASELKKSRLVRRAKPPGLCHRFNAQRLENYRMN